MRENFIIEFFGLRKEQKENKRKILRALFLIVGSIFIAEGIMSFFPETLEKGALIGIGLLLVIFAVLGEKE